MAVTGFLSKAWVRKALQISSISTSFLSIASIPPPVKSLLYSSILEKPDKQFTWVESVLDVISNFLSIGSRVLALALFASVEKYWFIGLVSGQILLVTLIGLCITVAMGQPLIVTIAPFFGVVSIFTLVILDVLGGYCVYIPYWILMMAENATFIYIWYKRVEGEGLWYHNVVTVYVILSAYILALIVKIIHVKYYNRSLPNLDSRADSQEVSKIPSPESDSTMGPLMTTQL